MDLMIELQNNIIIDWLINHSHDSTGGIMGSLWTIFLYSLSDGRATGENPLVSRVS